MSIAVLKSEVMPAASFGPPASPRARVAVAVSLNFPDLTEEVAGLVRRFTRVALETLWEVGASFELLDTSLESAARFDPGTLDGLLVLGGGDIHPSCYSSGGSEVVSNSYGIDLAADEQTLEMIGVAERFGRPVLGICRGHQLINVYRGGTIIPDVDDPSHLHHGGPGEPMFLDEHVMLTAGTRLQSILGVDEVIGRAGHHQAVDSVGRELVVAASALDGGVEAVEDPTRWVVGVQWHPEDDDGPVADRVRLFDAFVSACVRTASARLS